MKETKTLTDIIEIIMNRNTNLSNQDIISSIINNFKDDYKNNTELSFDELVKSQFEFLELFYIDYVNNYISVTRISNDYCLSNTVASQYINIGRLINHNK